MCCVVLVAGIRSADLRGMVRWWEFNILFGMVRSDWQCQRGRIQYSIL